MIFARGLTVCPFGAVSRRPGSRRGRSRARAAGCCACHLDLFGGGYGLPTYTDDESAAANISVTLVTRFPEPPSRLTQHLVRWPGLPPGTGRAPLELDAAELIERHAAGESISQIARDLKVSRATVRKRLSP
jgi:hypothetical protein